MLATAELTDIRDANDVRRFVDAFYSQVREDDILGVIFDQMANVNWREHLPAMYRFWTTVLLHQQGYRGNPIEAHTRLDADMRRDHDIGLAEIAFERWLALFDTTIDSMFRGARAERAKRGAKRMGAHIQAALLL